MAFVGKKVVSTEKVEYPAISVSACRSRLGIVFRKGLVPAGTKVSVLVGTEEDKGKVLVKQDADGYEVESVRGGDTTTSVSISLVAVRDNLTSVTRKGCEFVGNLTEGFLITVNEALAEPTPA